MHTVHYVTKGSVTDLGPDALEGGLLQGRCGLFPPTEVFAEPVEDEAQELLRVLLLVVQQVRGQHPELGSIYRTHIIYSVLQKQ